MPAMLKWAMRIVAVGGALLALAVGTAAWMHRTQGRDWFVVTPAICSYTHISPQYATVWGWLRREQDPDEELFAVRKFGRFGAESVPDDSNGTFSYMINAAAFFKQWRGFGYLHGSKGATATPSFTAMWCPTWAVIGFLLLPMGLWAGIGWRQRRRAAAGHCVNCGYDLRATPEKCPECGSAA